MAGTSSGMTVEKCQCWSATLTGPPWDKLGHDVYARKRKRVRAMDATVLAR